MKALSLLHDKPFRIALSFLLLVFFSCAKKDVVITELSTDASGTIAAIPPQCFGNTWQLDNFFYRPEYDWVEEAPMIVYNNRVYVFDQHQSEIRFYDGMKWDSIPSPQIPHKIDVFNVGFVIGNKAYLGYTQPPDKDSDAKFYSYDFITNTWSVLAPFPALYRPGKSTASFVIGDKGYVTGGSNYPTPHKDLWEYNPATNQWTQKANIPGNLAKAYGRGFTLNNKGYVVCGQVHHGTTAGSIDQQITSRKLICYDPVTNSWSVKASFPGAARVCPSVFVIGGQAYVGPGAQTSNFFSEDTFFQDMYKYNTASDTWSPVASSPLNGYWPLSGFALGSKGYTVYKTTTPALPDFMIRYTPQTCIGSTPL